MDIFTGIGLKKGEVVLCDHDPQWEDYAEQTIRRLYGILKFEQILNFTPALEANGFYFIGFEWKERQPVYQCGESDRVQKEMTLLTHYIHVVLFGSAQWHTYLNVRDYLNSQPNEAKLYEQVKLQSSRKSDGNLREYHADKEMFVAALIERANAWKRKEGAV